METKGIISKILPFSSVDGPGNRSVIFLQGCNFTCQYCHNPETLHQCEHCGICTEFCKTQAILMVDGKVKFRPENCVQCDECIHHCPNLSDPRTTILTAKETIEIISKNIPYIRGITVSGGECTLQRDYLLELLKEAKKWKLSAFLDSNGSYAFWKDEELLNLCDAVMLDVKAYEEEEHKKITGAENKNVQKNLVFLAERKKLYEVRTVVVPELFSVLETIEKVGKALEPYVKEQDIHYKIISYRPIGVRQPYREKLKIPSASYLEEIQKWVERQEKMKDNFIFHYI